MVARISKIVDDYKDKKNDHQSIDDKSKYNVDCDNEENELLPEYSCTVNHSGFVLIKKEFTRKGLKATKRSWQRRYLYLWGTFL
ncbi:420_t:CDS:2, partial [Entrophospora sp. SA101]